MPYSGPDDTKLPNHVKQLSAAKRRQWIAVFNSAFEDCDGDDCEGKAMRAANGTVKNSEAMSLDQLRDKIAGLVNDFYPNREMGPWIAELFDEYAIIEIDIDEYYRVPYTISGEEVSIAAQSTWEQVERQQNWIKVIECQLTPRLKENEDKADFDGREWDVTIIGPKSPDDLITIEGREYLKSKNKRFYAIDALRENPHIWEGVKVYDNHLTDEQFNETGGMRSPVREWLGTIVSPVWEEASRKTKGIFKVVERALAQKLKDAWEQGVLDSIGLSIDSFIIPGQDVVHEGTRWPVVEGFKKALSVDLVGDPAAGGGFNRLIASVHQGELSMNEEERQQLMQDTVQAVLDALAKKAEAEEPDKEDQPEAAEVETPAEPEQPGATKPDAEPQESAVEARIEKIERQQQLDKCERLLEARLLEAKLPSNLAAVVTDLYRGHIFEEKELNRTIKQMKDAAAALDPTGRVTESGGGRGDVASHQLTVAEKAEAEFMRIVMGNTDFRSLEKANEDFVKERISEAKGYKAWQDDGRPKNYGLVKLSEWLRTFYGDPLTGASARVSEAVTTSTISSIVKNTVNIMIANDYAKRDRWWETVVRTEEVDSIDQATLVRVYGLSTLDVVNEGGTYTELAWADEEETAAFVKDGNFVGVTLEAMLQDKVNAIRTLPERLSSAWYNTKSARAAAVFTVNSAAGPVLSDSGALFNATVATTTGGHANLLTTALSLTAYGSARTAMRKQTDRVLGAGRKLQINPVYLLVPEDLETTALQIRNSELIPGSSNNDVNPHYQKFEIVVVPDWTDTNNWAIMGDPMQYPAIWDIVLTGNRVPSLYTADSETAGAMFTNDTLRWKIRSLSFRFSATYDCMPVSDFRPLHKSNVT